MDVASNIHTESSDGACDVTGNDWPDESIEPQGEGADHERFERILKNLTELAQIATSVCTLAVEIFKTFGS